MKIKRYATDKLLTMWRELERAKIPLEPEQYRIGWAPEAERDRLVIEAADNGQNSRVFPYCRAGGTACILDVVLTSNLRGKMAVTDWSIEFPWPLDSPFLLVPDPKEMVPESDCYVLPDKQEFPRAQVLNHRVYDHGALTRGSFMRGLLLGCSFSSIPREYSHGRLIAVRLTVFDQLHRTYSQELNVRISRRVANSRKRTERKGYSGVASIIN